MVHVVVRTATGEEDFEEMLAGINHLKGDEFLMKIGDYSIIFSLEDIVKAIREEE